MTLWNAISLISLLLGLFSALYIAVRLSSHLQKMKIMNVVWILTGLWASIIGLWAYLRFGESKKRTPSLAGKDESDKNAMSKMDGMNMREMAMGSMHSDKPFWQKVTLSALHCGAGCTLADIIGEGIGYFWLHELHGWSIYWQWGFDYLLALMIGVLFQYAAIHPMLKLPVFTTLGRALKIDFLSLTAWQIGMYVFVYIVFFVFPAQIFLQNSLIFWFVMQLAMCSGFLLAYPMNWFLITKGIKPSM